MLSAATTGRLPSLTEWHRFAKKKGVAEIGAAPVQGRQKT
jgi:hypothetical protein